MILDDILVRTREDLLWRMEAQPLAVIEEEAARRAPARDLYAALRRPGEITCIAEFKRKSPSAGWMGQDANIKVTVRDYAAGGASALSVLTDGPFFAGSIADLSVARKASPLPILRKDFIVDRYQIVEARAAGADAILLIVAALSDAEMVELLGAARELGLAALVEAHDETEVARAVDVGAVIVGINNRDLKTFEVDRDLAIRLRPRVPATSVVVAESGIRDATDVARLRAAGIDAMLVGETLMRSSDPTLALRTLLG